MKFNIQWFDQLPSTNAYLRGLADENRALPSGTVIAAREQTAGRGRQNRQWRSAPNRNLCFSLFLRTDAELINIPALTMAAALAVDDLLHDQGISSEPKWPNDVLVGRRKICGILSGHVALDGGARGIIIGIGLNINMTAEEAAAIDRPATSILIETGRTADVSQTLEKLFQPLEKRIAQWESGGFEAIREEWTLKAGPVGKPLAVHDGEIGKSGTLAGFGLHGELLLQTANGMETIWSGDVS
ncbi:MAG: biotin--[acetyl-CoA-carboxylase] ligase [Kiritimatiellales bacterium]|nr:biotin--[acetyl-CoA-carboxylase] ligase [Kiritimatiellales bacterium]